MKTSEEWIINPCSLNLDKMLDNRDLKEHLMELCSIQFLESHIRVKLGRVLMLDYGYISKICDLPPVVLIPPVVQNSKTP